MSESKNLGVVTATSAILDLADGSHVEVKKLSLCDWSTIEEAACQAAKRNLILTYTENQDLLPESMREQKILEAYQRAEKITVHTMTGQEIFAWLTNTRKGDLIALWLGMKRANPSVTYDQADRLWADNLPIVRKSADRLIALSLSSLGNSEPPPATETTGATGTSQLPSIGPG